MALLSIVSMSFSPANNMSKFFFSIKLPQTIQLNPKYGVGLVEFQFSYCYFNVLEDEVWIHHYLPETDDNG